jgi:hypothetical protein
MCSNVTTACACTWAGPGSVANAGRRRRPAGARGPTDEFGGRAVENPCDVYDPWATVPHLLGLDQTDLTHRSGARDFRLTDVHGTVLRDLID